MATTHDPLKAKIEAEEAVRRQEDAAAAQAARVPMPGPLRDAFLAPPNTKVGPYEVRPVYDMDVEVLQAAEHPLYMFISELLTTGRSSVAWVPRGPDAWLACWMFTEDVDTVDAAWKDGTARDKAKAKFGMSQIAALVRLSEAVKDQCVAYSDTMIAYEPEPVEGKPASPPSQPEP